MEVIKNKLKIHNAGIILEVGTGTGKYIPTILNIFNGINEIIGIDLDSESIRQATKTYSGNNNLKFLEMNAEQLKYEDHTFDTVCISNALHHTPPGSKVLDEIKRVLKKDGLIFINELVCDNQNEAQLSHVMYHHFSAEIDQRLGIYHRHTYTKKEVLDIIEEQGISVEYLYEYNEPKQNVMSEQDIDLLSQACRNHIERTIEFDDHIEYKKTGEEIIERLNRVGIQRPTQMVVLGKVLV